MSDGLKCTCDYTFACDYHEALMSLNGKVDDLFAISKKSDRDGTGNEQVKKAKLLHAEISDLIGNLSSMVEE